MIFLLQAESDAATLEGTPAIVAILLVLALAPFLLTMITSFAKIVIVGGILRQALGMQQIPPNTVITGLALILTLHIMSPVVTGAYQDLETNGDYTTEGYVSAIEPRLRGFLEKHSDPRNVALFNALRRRLGTVDESPAAGENPALQPLIETLTVVAPAFVLTELTEAFQIGFLLFIPFLVLDLVVSNILLAMGMQMLSPITISLPLKILLFVLIDGWRLIVQGLVLGYA